MRPYAIVIFSSLVCSSLCLQAAPTGQKFEQEYLNEDIERKAMESPQQPRFGLPPQLDGSIVVTAPPPPQQDSLERDRFKGLKESHPYTAGGFLSFPAGSPSVWGGYFGYSWMSEKRNRWIVDCLIPGDLKFRPGFAQILSEPFSPTMKVFAKYGLATQLEASDQLAALINFENYQVRGGVGLEDYFSNFTFRLDFEAYVSVSDIGAVFMFSYIFSR